MKSKILPVALFSLFLGSCATSYHSRGITGGYSEIMTNPNAFIVTFSGNRYTSHEDTMKYVLLRASELTLKHGYRYFSILSSIDQTTNQSYSNTYTNTSASLNSKENSDQLNSTQSTSTHSGTIVRPAMSIRIKCFEEKPEDGDAIDARFYWVAHSED